MASSGDTLDSGTITGNKFLQTLYHSLPTGDVIGNLTVNSDSGSNYAYRFSDGGGTDSTQTSKALLEIGTSATSNDEFAVIYTINISTEEKLFIVFDVGQNAINAGTVPRRRELVGKWANTSNQITKETFTNVQSGSFNTDTNISVLGTD